MIKNNKKDITVLMPVYNEASNFLKKSIDSILHQTFSNFEFLIIDDGSTEKECLKILDEYLKKDSRIKIIRNKKNLGLVKSLNIGLEKAQGKFIARMDSDDISVAKRLEKQFDFMQKNKTYALCGSWAYIINENENIIGEKKFYTDFKEIKRKLLFFNFFTHSSFFFKKNEILKNGGYNENIKKAQDYDLLLKICAHYPIANLPEFLCLNRLHKKSISAKGKKKQEWYALIARMRAISNYGFPKIYFWKILPSLFYFLFVPQFIERNLLKFIHKKNV